MNRNRTKIRNELKFPNILPTNKKLRKVYIYIYIYIYIYKYIYSIFLINNNSKLEVKLIINPQIKITVSIWNHPNQKIKNGSPKKFKKQISEL